MVRKLAKNSSSKALKVKHFEIGSWMVSGEPEPEFYSGLRSCSSYSSASQRLFCSKSSVLSIDSGAYVPNKTIPTKESIILKCNQKASKLVLQCFREYQLIISFDNIKLMRFYTLESELFFFLRIDLHSKLETQIMTVRHGEKYLTPSLVQRDPSSGKIGDSRTIFIAFWTRAISWQQSMRLVIDQCSQYAPLEEDLSNIEFGVYNELIPLEDPLFCSNCEDDVTLAGSICSTCNLALCRQCDLILHRSRTKMMHTREWITPLRLSDVARRSDVPGCLCVGGDTPADQRPSCGPFCACHRDSLFCGDQCACVLCANPFNYGRKVDADARDPKRARYYEDLNK